MKSHPKTIKLNHPHCGIIDFGPWEFEKKSSYWLRKDMAPRESKWSQDVGFNYAVGFLAVKENATSPRIFASDEGFLLETWFSFNTQLPWYIDDAKETMDNFIRLFD